jgi:hypothetical protein
VLGSSETVCRGAGTAPEASVALQDSAHCIMWATHWLSRILKAILKIIPYKTVPTINKDHEVITYFQTCSTMWSRNYPCSKTTNDLDQGLTIVTSEKGSSSLNTRTAGYSLQKIPTAPIDQEQGQEIPDLGLCSTPAGSNLTLISDFPFPKKFWCLQSLCGECWLAVSQEWWGYALLEPKIEDSSRLPRENYLTAPCQDQNSP